VLSARSEYQAAYDALRVAEAVYESARAALSADILTCPDCEQTFDLLVDAEADDWFYGHDC
jgi:hypothetical protein